MIGGFVVYVVLLLMRISFGVVSLLRIVRLCVCVVGFYSLINVLVGWMNMLLLIQGLVVGVVF